MQENSFRVVISGSFRKFQDVLASTLQEFKDLGTEVLSPPSATIISTFEGFVSLKGDLVSRIDNLAEQNISQVITQVENSHLKAVQDADLLWLILPQGYCGVATAFEIGWAIAHKIPVYTFEKDWFVSKEPIVRAYVTPISSIAYLVKEFDGATCPRHHPFIGGIIMDYVAKQACPSLQKNTGNATIAVGAMIVDYSKRYAAGEVRDVLLVETEKWGGRLSIVGGRLEQGEKLLNGLTRQVREQTGLDGDVAELVCAFDELPDGGYWISSTQRVFIDRVVKTSRRNIQLDHRATRAVWMNPYEALALDNVEPNARTTLEAHIKNLV